MGEVYRARDTKLNREVALKVLPDLFADDPDRLARFTREAQTLAALNHPNIAHIHGLEESSGVRALVMELVDGDDLSAIIARGPMALTDALPIAKQIADALEAAHEQGIIHRDLKPANIKVRADGTVKVLDFGLAKALTGGAEGSGGRGDSANSPTLTARATQMGMIIGTAAYMAPEQARGRAVDRRADIWAFGVVLYEMLTGRRAFEGDDISITLASVLKEDPKWAALPGDLPAPLHRLLRRCLDKDPKRRLSAIGDARLELDEQEQSAVATPSSAAVARPSMFSRIWPVLAGIVATLAIVAFAWPSTASAPTVGGLARLAILPPPGADIYPDSASVAISPDGTMVAFVVGSVTQAETELWVRSLDSTSARRLDDAAGALLPFWSPDSKRIGFFTSTKLKTIAAAGGRADTLCDAPGARGGTWNAAKVIVFAPDFSGPLFKIPASGGTPEPVTKIDPARKESSHRIPTFLPDGVHFLYATLPGKAGKFDIFAGSLADDSRILVGSMESAPVYAPSTSSGQADHGWLLFARQGVLAAQAFDAATLKTSGDPVPLADEPSSILDPATSFTAGKSTSISNTGSLAYFSSPSLNTTATWYNQNGQSAGTLNLPPGHYETATISPDGTQAVFVRSTSPSESALWLVDLARGSASPLSSGPGRNDTPIWSPDGKRVIFAADREGPQNIYVKTIGDASPEQLLFKNDLPFKVPSAWSGDSQWIVLTQLDPVTAQNVWLLSANGTGAPTTIVKGPTRDNGGPISPDGHWLAFASDDTGRFELYVQPFPTPGPRVPISQQGAAGAWWTKDMRQIIFVGGDLHALWSADIQAGATFHAGTPRKIATIPSGIVWMDAMPNRQKFLVIAPERIGIGSVTVVQNWRAALEGKR
jgi:serine/threonine protein kinase